MKNKFTILFLIFLFTNSLFSQNLIVNGGFENGGSGVGFVTNGRGDKLLNAPYSGTTATGNLEVATNPKIVNTSDFIFEAEHTTATGKMLVIDGNTTANSSSCQLGATAVPKTICSGGTSTIKAAEYTFTSTPGVSLDPMIGSTTILNSGNDNSPSAVTNIGFNFNFGGTTYTQYSVSPDGWLLLGGASPSSQPINSITSAQNTPKLYPFWDDLATGTNGNVKVLVTGIAPNRIFIVEWNVTIPKNNAGAANSTFQMWMYESTNVIEYHYGAMGVQTSNSISGGYTIGSTNFSSITFASNTASITTPGNNANNTVPLPGTTYTYTPLSSFIWSPITNLYTDAAATNAYTGDSRNVVYATPAAGATYTVTGTNTSGCVTTSSVTINVNPLPNVTSTSLVQTICPGNTATFTITGTPNTTVTLSNSTDVVNIDQFGIGTYTTPPLNASVVYQLTKIKVFLTSCERNLIPSAITLSVNVLPNGCATVATIPAPGTLPLGLALCTTGECRTLEANVSQVASTTSYAVSSIPYCPQAAYENPSWINIGPGSTFGDDDWSDGFSFPAGMNFCFYGQNYTQLNVGTNGVIRFPNPNLFIGGDNCPWAYTQTIPNAGFPITNAIFGVYQDIDFSVTPPAGVQISVNYQVVGSYPCRKFIANFTNVPQFSCGNTVGLSTSQIVLYEVSNIIEVYVQRRTACTGWNGGRGTIGVINSTGLQAVAAPGRNAVPFSTDPTPNNSTNTDNVSEAWRFTPTGTNVSQTINWYQGPATPANFIGTGPTLQVCPTVTTNYTLETVYDVCGVPQKASSPIILNVNPDLTNSPTNITQCSNSFDLTVNYNVILGTLTPSDYSFTFHTSAAQAAAISNPIPNPSAFVSSGQTIYVAIYLNAFGCTVVKSFNLIISCGTISPVPDLRLCESVFGIGTATFDLSPQTAIALGTQISSNYVFSYYTSQAAANAGILGTNINPINSFLSANQTIYIRMQEVANSSTFFTTNFNLIVNPLPTITGSLIVC